MVGASNKQNDSRGGRPNILCMRKSGLDMIREGEDAFRDNND